MWDIKDETLKSLNVILIVRTSNYMYIKKINNKTLCNFSLCAFLSSLMHDQVLLAWCLQEKYLGVVDAVLRPPDGQYDVLGAPGTKWLVSYWLCVVVVPSGKWSDKSRAVASNMFCFGFSTFVWRMVDLPADNLNRRELEALPACLQGIDRSLIRLSTW